MFIHLSSQDVLVLLLMLFGWLVNQSPAVGTGAEIKRPVLTTLPGTYSTNSLCLLTVGGRGVSKKIN